MLEPVCVECSVVDGSPVSKAGHAGQKPGRVPGLAFPHGLLQPTAKPETTKGRSALHVGA